MAAKCAIGFTKTNGLLQQIAIHHLREKFFHTSSVLSKRQSGKVKPSLKKNKPITYEQSLQPQHIAHRKSWNSWNTSTIEGGQWAPEILFDDIFIRKFITGTFHNMVSSEIIIKRQFNIIRIAVILFPRLSPPRLGFLVGYTEEMLSYWFQAPVKFEPQIIGSPKDVVFQYI